MVFPELRSNFSYRTSNLRKRLNQLCATSTNRHRKALSRRRRGGQYLLHGTSRDGTVGCGNRTYLAGAGAGELYDPTDAEKKSIQFRRSLYVVQDLKAGDVLTKGNVQAIRPGLGLPTKYLDELLGRKVRHDVKRGTVIEWNLLA